MDDVRNIKWKEGRGEEVIERYKEGKEFVIKKKEKIKF